MSENNKGMSPNNKKYPISKESFYGKSEIEMFELIKDFLISEDFLGKTINPVDQNSKEPFYGKSETEFAQLIEDFLKTEDFLGKIFNMPALKLETASSINPVDQNSEKIVGEEMIVIGSWSDWITYTLDCLTDLPHCLGFDIYNDNFL